MRVSRSRRRRRRRSRSSSNSRRRNKKREKHEDQDGEEEQLRNSSHLFPSSKDQLPTTWSKERFKVVDGDAGRVGFKSTAYNKQPGPKRFCSALRAFFEVVRGFVLLVSSDFCWFFVV